MATTDVAVPQLQEQVPLDDLMTTENRLLGVFVVTTTIFVLLNYAYFSNFKDVKTPNSISLPTDPIQKLQIFHDFFHKYKTKDRSMACIELVDHVHRMCTDAGVEETMHAMRFNRDNFLTPMGDYVYIQTYDEAEKEYVFTYHHSEAYDGLTRAQANKKVEPICGLNCNLPVEKYDEEREAVAETGSAFFYNTWFDVETADVIVKWYYGRNVEENGKVYTIISGNSVASIKPKHNLISKIIQFVTVLAIIPIWYGTKIDAIFEPFNLVNIYGFTIIDFILILYLLYHVFFAFTENPLDLGQEQEDKKMSALTMKAITIIGFSLSMAVLCDANAGVVVGTACFMCIVVVINLGDRSHVRRGSAGGLIKAKLIDHSLLLLIVILIYIILSNNK